MTLTTLGILVYVFFNFILFSKVNRRKLSLKEIGFSVFFYFSLSVFTGILARFIKHDVFGYVTPIINGLFLSYFCFRSLPKSLIIFYGLFPITIHSFIHRFFLYFVLPLVGIDVRVVGNSIWSILLYICGVFLALLSLKWLGYDFSILRRETLDNRDKKILYMTNWFMFVYYLFLQILSFVEYREIVVTLEFRKLLVVFLVVLFMGIIHQLDKNLRQRIQEQLAIQQRLQLKNMEKYSQHIEGLYREVRGFRHDYTNLLTTLRLGIENEDMGQVKEIYDSVLKDSNKKLRNAKYDVGRLININNSALKSLLAAKFTQAKESQIDVALEVPDLINPQGIALVDFITIVSILCDNAIEATLEASQPQIRIAYLATQGQQILIVENSIKEEFIDVKCLSDFENSSKGEDRGIGLYNVQEIIGRYPNLSLATNSQDYFFRQILSITL